MRIVKRGLDHLLSMQVHQIWQISCMNTLLRNVDLSFNSKLISCSLDGCSSLTSITIPDSVTTIGSSAFRGCTSLTRFNGKFASEDNRCLIFDGELVAFARAGLTEYAIPDSVTSIGNYTFSDCTSLTSITIPDSVTSIGSWAFEYCTSLTSITIPDSVTSIGSYAFFGCTSLPIENNIRYADTYVVEVTDKTLTSYTLKENVRFIGEYAFCDCTSLTSITIPDSVTEIGSYAFSYCTSLKKVYCKPTTPPTGGSRMFSNNASGRNIYVPSNSVSAYKSASNWSNYSDKIFGYDF